MKLDVSWQLIATNLFAVAVGITCPLTDESGGRERRERGLTAVGVGILSTVEGVGESQERDRGQLIHHRRAHPGSSRESGEDKLPVIQVLRDGLSNSLFEQAISNIAIH